MPNHSTSWGFDESGDYQPRFAEPMPLLELDMLRFCARQIADWCLDQSVESHRPGRAVDTSSPEFEDEVRWQCWLLDTRTQLLHLQDDLTRRLGDCRN